MLYNTCTKSRKTKEPWKQRALDDPFEMTIQSSRIPFYTYISVFCPMPLWRCYILQSTTTNGAIFWMMRFTPTYVVVSRIKMCSAAQRNGRSGISNSYVNTDITCLQGDHLILSKQLQEEGGCTVSPGGVIGDLCSTHGACPFTIKPKRYAFFTKDVLLKINAKLGQMLYIYIYTHTP